MKGSLSGPLRMTCSGLSSVLLAAVLWSTAGAASAQTPLEVATSVALLEGPASDSSGDVYFSDVVGSRILKLGANGELSVYRPQSNLSAGLLIDAEGHLVACEGGKFSRWGVNLSAPPRVTRTTIATGVVEVLTSGAEGQGIVAPNDLTIDGKGRLYFTDMGGTGVYRIDGPGRVVRILGAPDIQNPNGIQVSPDDGTLYVAEFGSKPGERRDIRAFDLWPDGSAHRPRQLYDFVAGRGPDGMSIDTEGNLYISAGAGALLGDKSGLETRPGVYVVSPTGSLLEFISVPQDVITNNAFGGDDMKTLYVTAGPTLYRFRRSVAGLRR